VVRNRQRGRIEGVALRGEAKHKGEEEKRRFHVRRFLYLYFLGGRGDLGSREGKGEKEKV